MFEWFLNKPLKLIKNAVKSLHKSLIVFTLWSFPSFQKTENIELHLSEGIIKFPICWYVVDPWHECRERNQNTLNKKRRSFLTAFLYQVKLLGSMNENIFTFYRHCNLLYVRDMERQTLKSFYSLKPSIKRQRYRGTLILWVLGTFHKAVKFEMVTFTQGLHELQI